jgi:hypothetical protein
MEMNADEAESVDQEQVKIFEKKKSYLINRFSSFGKQLPT